MASILYRQYVGESDLPYIMRLVQSELSEPYVIYTFRYFLHQWPHLSFLAYPSDSPTGEPVGVVVCKQSMHNELANRGYIAMLSVDKKFRKRGIGRYGINTFGADLFYLPFSIIATGLVRNSIEAMKQDGVDEVVLETEYDNFAALSLYESLGFIREKRLYRFYLNGKDAFRLVLAIPPSDDEDNTQSASPNRSNQIRHLSNRAICVSPYSDDEDEESSR
ncbi:acyl-CoA N-acyltransferase [Crepidotus variabilis]|uniref:Acyl-CoA N-acyltransferase n=1 Tax=Crepidotus variabilis TaxID=179855 RepID=A0A9P6EHK2_9AGAR|nr:acyl-CoA N-acyltransferase [Crepidotus variabilis]